MGGLEREYISLPEWEHRIYVNHMRGFDLEFELSKLNKYCSEVEDILQDVGLGTGFYSRKEEIYEIKDFESEIWRYLMHIPEEIKYKIDEPLHKGFNKAINYMATIDMSKIETDNTIGLTGIRSGIGRGMGYSIEEKLPSLTLEDFIGSRVGEKKRGPYSIFSYTQCVDGFADMFKEQYEQLNGDKDISLKEYLDSLVIKEFPYKKASPFYKELLQSLCDITIVIPIYEMCTGKTLVTQDPLSSVEINQKSITVAVSIITVGTGASVIADKGLKVGIKIILSDILADAVSTMTIEVLNGSPESIKLLAGLLAGIATGQIANKVLLKFSVVRSYYRFTYIEAFKGYVIEYANIFEEAKNNVFEDGDIYPIDMDDKEFIEMLREDLIKYFRKKHKSFIKTYIILKKKE